MYTLLIGDNNCITTTNSERIVQRSKLAHTICIYVSNYYNGVNMQDCEAIMYYRTPISGEWKVKELTPSEGLYKEKYVEYLFNADTWLTAEAGDVQFEIKFYQVSMNEKLEDIDQYVRKATDGIIHISDSKDWSSGIADSMLDAVDQRIIQLMMLQNGQKEMIKETQSMVNSKADGIAKDEETNEIYLTANGVKLGKGVIDSDTCIAEDGVPVVDFTVVEPEEPDDKLVNNVVEF